MLGDFWTLAIVQNLENGEKRFCELQRSLPNASPTTLAGRLKKLERRGVIRRREDVMNKLSVSYMLTKKGSGILPVLREIKNFSAKYS
jgi:DNA-binding HxlR family transcriptional regulator